MAARMTLNISEPQVLVHLPGDPTGLEWHHRILLKRAGDAGTWVCVTPEKELCVHDLTSAPHKVLLRASAFPAGIAPGEIFSLDPITRSDIAEWKRMAKTQALILASGDAAVRYTRSGANIVGLRRGRKIGHRCRVNTTERH